MVINGEAYRAWGMCIGCGQLYGMDVAGVWGRLGGQGGGGRLARDGGITWLISTKPYKQHVHSTT